MIQYGTYLVCNEHLKDVKKFLKQFFEPVKGKYEFSGWVTFQVPGVDYSINLMRDEEQPLTQHMAFEIYCSSKTELDKLANRYKVPVQNFVATTAPQKYRYYYCEIAGPADICKIEINFIEDL